MEKEMKAARLHRIGDRLKVETVKAPKIRANEVEVEIKAAGICHSDLNYRDGVSPITKLPLILGHEISGTVLDKGKNVEVIDEGSRVCIHYVRSCGECVFCRSGRENLCESYQMIGKDVDGGFADSIVVPAENVLELPESISFESGALIGCAVSTAFHSLRRARVRMGDVVVAFGVGGVGLHAVQLADRVFGASKVIAVDISDHKLEHAGKLGARAVINPGQQDVIGGVRKFTDGKLADVVIDFVGLRSTIEKAIECVGKGGKLAIVGIGNEDVHLSPYKTLIGREMEIVGVNDHLKSEMATVIELVSSGKVDLSHSVSHRFPLEDVNHGLEILEKKVDNPLRIIIAP